MRWTTSIPYTRSSKWAVNISLFSLADLLTQDKSACKTYLSEVFYLIRHSQEEKKARAFKWYYLQNVVNISGEVYFASIGRTDFVGHSLSGTAVVTCVFRVFVAEFRESVWVIRRLESHHHHNFLPWIQQTSTSAIVRQNQTFYIRDFKYLSIVHFPFGFHFLVLEGLRDLVGVLWCCG